jgi:hypothetical protein
MGWKDSLMGLFDLSIDSGRLFPFRVVCFTVFNLGQGATPISEGICK